MNDKEKKLEDNQEVNDELKNATADAVVSEIDKHGRSYATGKRKSSIARVWLKLGSGKIIVNGIPSDDYFKRETHRIIISQPLDLVSRSERYDVVCSVSGGGLSGQAGALRHGLSKALTGYEPELRPSLKEAGLIKRDARRVERKKYGQPKARRSFQFSKR